MEEDGFYMDGLSCESGVSTHWISWENAKEEQLKKVGKVELSVETIHFFSKFYNESRTFTLRASDQKYLWQ